LQCPTCFAHNPDLAVYCSNCGRPLANAQQPYQPPYGQSNYAPPPPPDMEQPSQMTGPVLPAYAPGNATSQAVDKKICPECNKKLNSAWIPAKTCIFCRTTFHSKCFSTGSLSVSTKSAIALYPNKRKDIVNVVLGSKLAHTWTPGRVQSMPEEELIKGTTQEFCKFCIPKVREMAPKVGRDLEKAARYEDAGDLFEEFGLFEEAGVARKKASKQVVTNITIDINQLLEKLKSGGMVSVYKCPNCGASIKISGDTTTTQLSKCEFCGTVLRTDDLMRFIQDILG
jgi:uncharacterized protein (UPF0212 family)